MLVKEKLREEQIVAYKTLYNSFSMHKNSHAYLISGTKGSPLKDVALFIAQSLVCEEDVLACEECNTCKRIKNGSYVDLSFINKEGSNILKEDIEKLQEDFSLSCIEKAGKKIYIIHLIEKANAVAVNRLLKFIEEPSDDIVGILTTENLSRVLPTIVSRCQLIRLKASPKTKLLEDLKKDFSKEDSELLSTLVDNVEEAKELLETFDFNSFVDLAKETVDQIFNHPNAIMYHVMHDVEPKLEDKDDARLYLDILQFQIKKLIQNGFENKYNMPIEDILNIIMLQEGKLDYNLNINLLLDQLFIQIMKKGGLV